MFDSLKGAISTIHFDSEKKGYNKEQVTKYFELVQKEYEKVYAENQNLRAQLQQAQKLADEKPACDIPPDRMEAIASALVSAQAEAQRIVDTAREKAWQILTDAQKGLPVPEVTEKRSLPINTEKLADTVAYQPREPSAGVRPKSAIEKDIDKLIESILKLIQNRPGGVYYGEKS